VRRRKMVKIIKIKCEGFKIGGVTRCLGEEISCFWHNSKDKDDNDFVSPFKNSGLNIEEEEVVILDTASKKADSIFILSKKPQIITYTRASFLLTSQKRYIGIKGKNAIPLAIYYLNGPEKIWVAGIVRNDKKEIDLRNLSTIFLILNMEMSGSINIMIGPSLINTNNFLIDFLEREILEREIAVDKIYQCQLEPVIEPVNVNFKVIFYFRD